MPAQPTPTAAEVTVHPTASIPRVAYKNWRQGTLQSNLPVSAPLANVESSDRNGYVPIKFPDEIKTGKRLHTDSLYKFYAVRQHFQLLAIVYSTETQLRLAESKELRLLRRSPELLLKQEFAHRTANPSLSAPNAAGFKRHRRPIPWEVLGLDSDHNSLIDWVYTTFILRTFASWNRSVSVWVGYQKLWLLFILNRYLNSVAWKHTVFRNTDSLDGVI